MKTKIGTHQVRTFFNENLLNIIAFQKLAILLLIFGFFLSSKSLFAQTPPYGNCIVIPTSNQLNSIQSGSCNNTSSNSNPDFINKYRQIDTYLPYTAVPKIIKIAFHVFTGPTGSNTLQNNSNDIASLNQIKDWLNGIYQNNNASSDPITGVPLYPSTNIQFELDNRIYFYDGTSYWNQPSAPLSYVQANFPSRLEYLPIFFVGEGIGYPYAHSPFPSYISTAPSSAFSLNDDLLVRLGNGNNPGSYYDRAQTMAHELGHCLDLMHTYDGNQNGIWNDLTGGDSPYPEIADPTHLSDFMGDLFDINGANWCNSSNGWLCYNQGSWSMDPYSASNHATNNVMGGCNFYSVNGFYFSPLQIAKMHRACYLKTTRRYVKDCSYDATLPIIITQNETWDFDIRVYQDIIIEPGNTLTVTCKISLPEGAKIIVKPGAQLILDGGTLTASCSNMWAGIEVWGNRNLRQTSANQGKLRLKNGALIEHAREAVTLWDATNGDWNKTGGIVQAINSTFKNNRRSVQFMSYHNNVISNGNTSGNFSYFTNCHFFIDDDFRAGNDFDAHVTIWDCEWINFRHCSFENRRTSVSSQDYLGAGIRVADGSFYAGNSSFIGLKYGINAFKTANNHPFSLDGSTFDKNIFGICGDGVNNIFIAKNKFIIGGNSTPFTSQPYAHTGIEVNTGSSYRIEENQMSIDPVIGPFTLYTMGTFLLNTGPANNQVYKNSYSGLHAGNFAQGRNRDNNSAMSGLQFLCNDQPNMLGKDILVQNDLPSHSDDGIRLYQGDPLGSISAGNTFTHNTLGCVNCDISNESNWPIIYYHAGGSTEPWYHFGTTAVYPILSSPNTCPSNFIDNALYPNPNFSVLEGRYNGSETAYLNLLYAYNQLMDGGNTNALLTQIELTWPAEVWQLRNELIAKSPYLSEGALLETAKKNVLPQAMLFEICMANPDATKSQDFLKILQYEIENPLPEYMIDMIISSHETKTVRTIMEGKLASYSHEMAFTSDAILAGLYSASISDSIPIEEESDPTWNPNDSIRYWLNRIQTLPAKYDLLENYFSCGDNETAKNILSSIPTNFNLSKQDQLEYARYKDYFNLRSNVINSGRNLMELNEGEIETIRNFAEAGNDLAGVMAQNLLCFGYHICQEYYPNISKEGQRKSHFENHKRVIDDKNKVEVSPNPAVTYTTFSYKLTLLNEKAVLSIIDVTGRTMDEFTILNKEGQFVWDTRNIIKGIYLYQVKDGDEIIATGKVVVIK